MTVFSAELDIPTQTILRVLLSTSPLELTDQSTKEKEKLTIRTRNFCEIFFRYVNLLRSLDYFQHNYISLLLGSFMCTREKLLLTRVMYHFNFRFPSNTASPFVF